MSKSPSFDQLFEAASNGSLDKFSAENREASPTPEPTGEEPADQEVETNQEVEESEEAEADEEESDQEPEADVEEEAPKAEPEGKKIVAEYEKKAKDAEAGMRKAFAERDALRKEREALEAKLAEQQALWAKIEEAAEDEDYDMLAKIMTKGKYESATDLLKKQEAWASKYAAADDETKALMLKARQADKLQRELEKKSAQENQATEAAKEAARQAELAESRATLRAIHNEYSFTGKLGDPAREQVLNELIWNQVVNHDMKKYQGDEIPEDVAKQMFKDRVEALNGVVDTKVKEVTQKVAKARKKKATEEAQQIVKAGGDRDSLRAQFDRAVKDGTVADLMFNPKFKQFIKDY